MTVKVELGFTEEGQGAPFFTLDDPVLGVLDSPTVFLGGADVFVDVTQFFDSYSLNRGKSRELDKYEAGQASVSFQNSTRAFDPTFEASPYFGQIEPRRQIRITVDDVVQYEGTIDDWNISYDRGGNSVSTAQCFDGFANLANIGLESFSPTEELTGPRVEAALDNIDWPEEKRNIDTGNATLEAQTVEDGTGILEYLQTVANSEPGEVFIDKNGNVRFVQRNAGFSADRPLLSDAGDGIGYKTIAAQFGVELLFNRVTTSNSTLTATAFNQTSINLYGERDLQRPTFLSNQTQLDGLADFLTGRFADPEFRFEQLEIDLRTISAEDKATLLGLELGDVIEVKFTPNDIPPAIERFGRIINIQQRFDPFNEILVLGLQSTQGALLVLGDPEFGKIGTDNVLGF